MNDCPARVPVCYWPSDNWIVRWGGLIYCEMCWLASAFFVVVNSHLVSAQVQDEWFTDSGGIVASRRMKMLLMIETLLLLLFLLSRLQLNWKGTVCINAARVDIACVAGCNRIICSSTWWDKKISRKNVKMWIKSPLLSVDAAAVVDTVQFDDCLLFHWFANFQPFVIKRPNSCKNISSNSAVNKW